MKCCVIIPVGPGHQKVADEARASVNEALEFSKGFFQAISLLLIDDTDGSIGRSAARNSGIEKAAKKGADWLFFLDADDLIRKDVFEAVGTNFSRYDAVWGTIMELKKGETDPQLRIPQRDVRSIRDLFGNDPFLTLQIGHFVRTEVALTELFAPQLDVGEDFHYFLRLWDRYRCVKIRRPLFVNRRGFSSVGQRAGNGSDWRLVVEKLIRDYRASWRRKRTSR